MEDFSGNHTQTSIEIVKGNLDHADVVIFVFGHTYGSIIGDGLDPKECPIKKLCNACKANKISFSSSITHTYPIYFGAYSDWWKWAEFRFCSHKEYMKSIVLRKNRLENFQSIEYIEFDEYFKPIDLNIFHQIFYWIQKIENNAFIRNVPLYNLSCSCDQNGRIIFWDLQTPIGKLKSYC